MTEADERVAQQFPHGDCCHAKGCPSLGFCMEVGTAFIAWQDEHPERTEDEATAWLVKNDNCGSRECDCATGIVQQIVREERALVLEQVAEASYTSSANKPPRVVRVMRRSAQMIREGLA